MSRSIATPIAIVSAAAKVHHPRALLLRRDQKVAYSPVRTSRYLPGECPRTVIANSMPAAMPKSGDVSERDPEAVEMRSAANADPSTSTNPSTVNHQGFFSAPVARRTSRSNSSSSGTPRAYNNHTHPGRCVLSSRVDVARVPQHGLGARGCRLHTPGEDVDDIAMLEKLKQGGGSTS